MNSDVARFTTHDKKTLATLLLFERGWKNVQHRDSARLAGCCKTVAKVCVACWVPTSFPEAAILSVSTKDRLLPVATVKGSEGSKDEVDGG